MPGQPNGFLSEPAEELRCVMDLGNSFGVRLTVLHDNQLSDKVLALNHQFIAAPENLGLSSWDN